MKRKIFIRTFGCQMNMRDSEIIAGILKDARHKIVDDDKDADVILFNTCSVRQHAEDRVISEMGRFAGRKRKNPDLVLGIVGCMAERHGERLLKKYPYLDIVVGPNNIYDLPELIKKIKSPEKALAVGNVRRPEKKIKNRFRAGKFSALVNIMFGCDNYCSYCIVPYVRGREISRPKKDIIDEIKDLADKGVKEITLLGQNVNSYGKGLTNRITFPGLLEGINDIKGIERIRFMTSHAKDAEKGLFRAMRDLDKVCEHLHLPLQSASDRILDLMNRKYTYDDYLRKIELLREMVPEVGVTTDLVVGFPSEKERDFAATQKAVEEIAYNAAFVFKYSPRPPAVSASLVDDVPEEVKKERHNALLVAQKEISHAKNKALIGTEQEILVEGLSRKSDKNLTGRTRGNTSCVFPGGKKLIGQLVRVRVVGSTTFTLRGEIT